MKNIPSKSVAKPGADFTIFKFDDKDVRVIAKDGEPWFVATDLCDVLNLTNSRVSLMALDNDEKGVSSIYTIKGNQEVAVVSESGMYTLILRCRDAVKPGTAPYRVRKWVTTEVLPSIRKTGSYEKVPSTKKVIPGKITADQQEAIKQLVLTRGHALPKENQARAIITMWSSLKSHFGCSYKDINEEQFTEALSLAARVPLEGELIPAGQKSVTLAAPGRYQLLQTIEANQVVESQLIGPKQFCATKDEFTSMMRWCGHVVALPEDLIKLTAVELAEYIQKCMARRREWISAQAVE
ncbi:hypothetical protein DN614_29690 [Klebsiella michiganensis]|nr:hypothetical protein DN614_29690 [Klebsiella michiganensis]